MYGRADGMPSCPQSMVVCDRDFDINIHTLFSTFSIPFTNRERRIEPSENPENGPNDLRWHVTKLIELSGTGTVGSYNNIIA